MSSIDWLALFTHFLSLSLLAVGGAITTVPDMHRYLVNERLWMSDSQFTASIALAQAAPGPNILFVALMGWNIGVNAAGGMSAGLHAWALGLSGIFLSMLGILLPSTTLTFVAARWGTATANCVQCVLSSRDWDRSWWPCWAPPAGFWPADMAHRCRRQHPGC